MSIPMLRLKLAMISKSPTIIRTLIFSAALLVVAGLIFWRWKKNSRPFTSEFSGITDTDHTRPNIDAAPVDLTKIGADITLPEDHPLRKMNGVTPGNLAPYYNGHMTRDEIANHLSVFDARITKLEGKDNE